MKYKAGIIIPLLLFVAGPLFSKNITVEDASRVAKNVFYELTNQYRHATTYGEVTITGTMPVAYQDKVVYYVFNVNDGFVIIPADDALPPVIGYSYDRHYQSDDQPDNYRNWMLNYAKEITYCRQLSLTATAEIKAEWDRLLTCDASTLITVTRSRDVEPLLTCMWNQDNPYNSWCPADPMGPGGHVYAGCVATAMSMVMYYWRYPLHGTGSHSYYAGSYGTLTANFGATYYNWNAMLDAITNGSDPESIDAIAQLQFHCGVSVDMNYSPNGSGANSDDVETALRNYFNYATEVNYVQKDNYSTTNWINLLKSQLDQSWPMYYSGFNGSGGHAFVCDGYQGDNFHFNFGWSGQNNGYYTVDDVGGFSFWQGAVVNIHPGDGYPYYWTEPMTLTAKSGSFEDGSGPVEDYLNDLNMSWLISPQNPDDSVSSVTLSFTRFETEPVNDVVTVYDGSSTDAPVLGTYSGTYSGSSLPVVTATGNTILVVFTTNDNTSAPGFQAQYISEIADYCQNWATLTDASGTVTDGSGTKNYNNNTLCRWKIAPPDASQITLTFTAFGTEAGHDIMQVIDLSADPPAPVGSFSGNTIPPTITTNGAMLINFYSNASITGPGWEAYYETDNVGINDQQLSGDLRVFPNPATDRLNVEYSPQTAGTCRMQLLSVTGEVVFNRTVAPEKENHSVSIDLSGVSKGIYVLRICGEKSVVTRKVVVE